jgi:hypothetical protein
MSLETPNVDQNPQNPIENPEDQPTRVVGLASQELQDHLKVLYHLKHGKGEIEDMRICLKCWIVINGVVEIASS